MRPLFCAEAARLCAQITATALEKGCAMKNGVIRQGP